MPVSLSYSQRLILIVAGFTFFVTLFSLLLIWRVVEATDIDEHRQQEQLLKYSIEVAIELAEELEAKPDQVLKVSHQGFELEVWSDTMQAPDEPNIDAPEFRGSVLSRHLNYRIVLHPELVNEMRGEQEDIIYIISAVVIATLLVTIMAAFLAKRLARPIIKLRQQVELLTPESGVLKPMKRNDEVGQLSRAFASQMERLRAFAKREQAFTRFASHELRSPVTLMRGNLDLLRQSMPDTPLNQRIIKRMDSATRRISLLIEAFLWLGRENKDSITIPTEPVDTDKLNHLIDELIGSLSEPERTRIRLDLAEINWSIKPLMLSIVLDNLIRNALIHSLSDVVLKATQKGIELTNSMDNSYRDTAQFGIGLQIVKKLCEQSGWHYEAGVCDGQYKVQIEINPDLN